MRRVLHLFLIAALGGLLLVGPAAAASSYAAAPILPHPPAGLGGVVPFTASWSSWSATLERVTDIRLGADYAADPEPPPPVGVEMSIFRVLTAVGEADSDPPTTRQAHFTYLDATLFVRWSGPVADGAPSPRQVSLLSADTGASIRLDVPEDAGSYVVALRTLDIRHSAPSPETEAGERDAPPPLGNLDAAASSPDVDYFLLVVSPDDGVALYALRPLNAVPSAASVANVGAPGRPGGRSGSKVEAAAIDASAPAASAWLVAALVSIVLLVAALVALRHAWPLAFLPFFSRFNRDDVLDHDRRSQLFDAIRADPGIAFGELCVRVGLENGVAQHHLRLLEQHELVRRVRDGRTTRFFARGPKSDRPLGLTPARQRIVDALRLETGLTATQLAARLGQRVQTTWEHLQLLRSARLIEGERRGRSTSWRLACPAAT